MAEALAREASPDAALSSFHEELRHRNLPVLFWSACVFNVAYLGWTGFDYLLARPLWGEFLILRAVAVSLNTAVVVAVHRPAFRRYTWEAFWAWLFVFGAFIALMLPRVRDGLYAYITGFTLILYAVGLLPYWKPRWAVSNAVAIVAMLPVAFLTRESEVSLRELVGAGFLVFTASGLSIVMASFKYDLAKRDFFSRRDLEAALRRESEARDHLARTSTDLSIALERLKELDRLKSQFFANVSHELRTPLTLILAPVEALIEATRDSEARQRLSVVRRNAERLLRLIDDLLDLSRLDARGLRLNVAEVDVRQIVATVCENARPTAATGSVELVLDGAASSRTIFGDAHRLEIVLSNLVGNALKYTPEKGRIEVRVEDAEEAVTIEIRNSGAGIPEEDLPHIFERFYQVERSDRRRKGGVGIGLALAKELVELHGGTIGASSEPGRGACFTVSFPFGAGHINPDVIERRRQLAGELRSGRRAEDVVAGAEAPHGSSPPEAISPLPRAPLVFDGSRKARIVLVEDNVEIREFIASLLTPSFDVSCAEDGESGWDLVRRKRPDLVISDIMMPGRMGTELCSLVKRDPVLRSTPVILLTARVGSEATLEGYRYGADEFVTKPFHPAVLLARVHAQLRLRSLAIQLAASEKLGAIGTLSAGILHEVRNPVNAILNGAEVLKGGAADEKTRKALVDVIADGALRIEGITAALEAHTRPAEDGSALLDLREGLDATLRLLAHRMVGVTVKRDYRTDRCIMGRAGQVNQVLLNVIDNAIRAGASTISIELRELGEGVRIRISDDGGGISPDVAGHVFDPFFTTREPGQGTGLGLHLSRRIVEEHGGRLWFESRDGQGTSFVIDLPSDARTPAARRKVS